MPVHQEHAASKQRPLSPFYGVGFHGDRYLLALAHQLLDSAEVFIETGANVGSTLAYVARTFPSIRCLSCEPDEMAFREAVKNTTAAGLGNVLVFQETSQNFLLRLAREHADLFSRKTVFWLDAHDYGYQWPLRSEVAFVTAKFSCPYLFIDDFKVPGLDCFGYDEYQGQECSFEYIAGHLDRSHAYGICYPAYTERTSPHHPLRGWVLIACSDGDLPAMPSILEQKLRRVDYSARKKQDTADVA